MFERYSNHIFRPFFMNEWTSIFISLSLSLSSVYGNQFKNSTNFYLISVGAKSSSFYWIEHTYQCHFWVYITPSFVLSCLTISFVTITRFHQSHADFDINSHFNHGWKHIFALQRIPFWILILQGVWGITWRIQNSHFIISKKIEKHKTLNS